MQIWARILGMSITNVLWESSLHVCDIMAHKFHNCLGYISLILMSYFVIWHLFLYCLENFSIWGIFNNPSTQSSYFSMNNVCLSLFQTNENISTRFTRLRESMFIFNKWRLSVCVREYLLPVRTTNKNW